MDRYVNQDGMDFQPGTVFVDLVFTSDGTDTTVTPTIGDGIASVTSTSDVFTVTFQDAYYATLNPICSGSVKQASFAASGACYLVPIAVTQAAGDPLSIQFQACKGSDGTKVHPASTDVVYVTFRLQRQAPT